MATTYLTAEQKAHFEALERERIKVRQMAHFIAKRVLTAMEFDKNDPMCGRPADSGPPAPDPQSAQQAQVTPTFATMDDVLRQQMDRMLGTAIRKAVEEALPESEASSTSGGEIDWLRINRESSSA